MKLIQIDHNPSSRQLFVFGVIWMVFFAIVGAILYNSGTSHWVTAIVWGGAIVVPAFGWLVPSFMRFVYVGMAYAAFPIGFVVSHLILVVVYYLVLTPIGLALRLFHYDPMQRSLDQSAETYWCPHEQDDDLSRYFKQF